MATHCTLTVPTKISNPMADQPNQQSINIDVSALVTALQLGNQQTAAIVTQLQTRFADQAATESRLAIAFSTASGTGTLVSSAPCYLVMISVTTASTGPTGLCYDSASTLNAGSSNAFMQVPASGVAIAGWPCQSGLVIQPSSQGSHTVSVSFI